MMAKRKTVSAPEPNRKHISRREREQVMQRRLIIGVASVLAVILLLLGWALFDQYVRAPSKPVATVNGQVIRLDTYQRLLQYRRWDYGNYMSNLQYQRTQFAAAGEGSEFMLQYIDQQLQTLQGQLGQLPINVLDELIDEQLVRLEAEKRGITVTSDDVQVRLEEQFGYQRNPPTPEPTPITATEAITVTPEPTPTLMTLEDYNTRSSEWFTLARQNARFSEQDFRRLLETSLYRERVEEALRAEAPATAEQIHARHILVETEEEAQAVLDRLAKGEDFADLAAELSQDTSNSEEGGDLGWFGRGRMVPEFEEAAFALQPGQTSGIVPTDYGFHIIHVEGYDANRLLEGYDLTAAQDEYIDAWYEERRASSDVVRSFDSRMVPTSIPTRVPSRG
jgi:parvulin-like peptidyl-prolyl isomerase